MPDPRLTIVHNACEAFIPEGMENVMEKGKLEAIHNSHADGLGIPLVARIVDMTAEEVRRILKKKGKDI